MESEGRSVSELNGPELFVCGIDKAREEKSESNEKEAQKSLSNVQSHIENPKEKTGF